MTVLLRDKNDRQADDGAVGDGIGRRKFLVSAGKASLGVAAAAGAFGVFNKPSMAADKVTKMGFDHPFSFVTYVSDIQRWGTTYANAHGLTALYTSDNGKLDAQIANLETWISQGVQGHLLLPDGAERDREDRGQGPREGHHLGELCGAPQEPGQFRGVR